NYASFYELVLSAQQYVEEAYARVRRLLGTLAYDAAVETTNEVLARYPEHPLFEDLKLEADKLRLAQAVVMKAHIHEEHGRYLEALERWHMVRRIFNQYPGIDAEIERLMPLAPVAQASLPAFAQAEPVTEPTPPATVV